MGKKYNDGVRFTEGGYLDFSPYLRVNENGERCETKIKLTGDRTKDAELANARFGFKQIPNLYVWHHVEDATTMQLIPRNLHWAVKHTGGYAIFDPEGK